MLAVARIVGWLMVGVVVVMLMAIWVFCFAAIPAVSFAWSQNWVIPKERSEDMAVMVMLGNVTGIGSIFLLGGLVHAFAALKDRYWPAKPQE